MKAVFVAPSLKKKLRAARLVASRTKQSQSGDEDKDRLALHR